MKIGIIADIHGDFVALQKALKRLEMKHQVEYIVCAGDLVGRGPLPNETVRLVREREIPTVRGNHDEMNYDVTPGTRQYLRSLPLEWRGTFGGIEVYMCHGKPGNNRWGIYRDHLSTSLLDMMLSSLNADVMITGHTHIPLFMRTDVGCLVNPGSLCTFPSKRYSSHTYGVLHLPDLTFDQYDLNELL